MMCKRWIFLAGLPLLVGLALILMLPPVSVGWAQSDDDKPNNVLYLPLISQPSEPIHEDTVHVATDQQGEAQLYLDQANGNSAESGTVENPFREFTDAVNVVSSGGNIAIQPGTYRAVGVLSKPMTLEAPQGSVTINYTTDTDGDGLDDNWEQALAEMYRPWMYFDTDESRWPSSARWFVQQSYLRNRRDEHYPEDAIYTQDELTHNPVLVLRAHDRGYKPSDLRLNPYPNDNLSGYDDDRFHIDILSEGDPYCGEGAQTGCLNNSQPDVVRLPTIPMYAVVHRLLSDVKTEPDTIDTTGLYRIHYEYGFAYNDVDGGAHEGDWERLEVFVDPSVEPCDDCPAYRASMLRAINYYAHKCSANLLLPGDSYFPSTDGIPQVYVEKGQHGFYSQPRYGFPNDYDCGLWRYADGKGVNYRVEKIVNLGEQFTRVVRLGESLEEIQDRNIALFFNGAFGERKSPTAPDGVESPGKRIPSLPRPEPDLSQFYVTPPFSEESPGFMQCPSGSALKGIRCSGSYCDNMELICQSYLAGSDNQAFLEWKGPISEEAPNNSFRTTSSFLSGLGCEGRYCDNVKLEVLVTPNLQNAGQCVAEPFISEEDGAAICWDGKFVAGLTCQGSYCDKLSIHCCSVKP